MNTGTSRNSIAPGNGRRIVRGLSGTQVAEEAPREESSPAAGRKKPRVRCRGKPSIEGRAIANVGEVR